MAKDPAFLFYSSDFLTGVSDLTMQERGQYITLLCLQHQKGHLTDKMIEVNCPGVSKDVMSKFEKDDEGNWYQWRLEQEHLKRIAYSESRASNRRKNKTYGKHMKNISNTYEEHMENENENENIYDIENANVTVYPSFDDFWDLYDKKVGDKSKIKKKWDKLSQSDKELIVEYIPDYKRSQPDKQFRKNPETFLNNKSWNDELIFKNDKRTAKDIFRIAKEID